MTEWAGGVKLRGEMHVHAFLSRKHPSLRHQRGVQRCVINLPYDLASADDDCGRLNSGYASI